MIEEVAVGVALVVSVVAFPAAAWLEAWTAFFALAKTLDVLDVLVALERVVLAVAEDAAVDVEEVEEGCDEGNAGNAEGLWGAD
jgi:hypothetical protein